MSRTDGLGDVPMVVEKHIAQLSGVIEYRDVMGDNLAVSLETQCQNAISGQSGYRVMKSCMRLEVHGEIIVVLMLPILDEGLHRLLTNGGIRIARRTVRQLTLRPDPGLEQFPIGGTGHVVEKRGNST